MDYATKRVAVVLAGAGFLDGTEISEAVLCLLHLSGAGVQVTCLAPDAPQHHSIDHLSGEAAGTTRNMLRESARIARGKVSSLGDARAEDFDALVFPGGYGAAKNLCTFALEGSKAKVHPQVEEFTRKFHQLDRPIGACCIAPALLALLFGREGITLTIGEDLETACEIEKTGAKHQNCAVDNVVVDSKAKIATTPAYMYDSAPLRQISEGIGKCVEETLRLS